MTELLRTQPPLIHINFFGGFSITEGEKTLTDGGGRAKQLWTLLEYLAANRHQDISQEKLIDVLWGEEESDNPQNALKNLVYRVRRMLADCFGREISFIVFRRNNYSWNNDLPCQLDIERFEEVYKASLRQGPGKQERLEACREMSKLYRGEFLPRSASDDWVVLKSTRYNRMYIESMQSLCRMYLDGNRPDKAIEVCQSALQADEFDETLHEMILYAYLLTGQRQKAVAHYEYAADLFYEKLGVKLSDRIRNMMRQTVKSEEGVETDLDEIKKDLKEYGEISGAYYCEYDIFRDIYRIQARLAERMGQSVFVALLTVNADESQEKERGDPKIAVSMQALRVVLLQSLRKSDVVARFSNTQYIIMLPSLTYENGQMVLRRLVGRFDQGNRYREITIGATLNPLDPAA